MIGTLQLFNEPQLMGVIAPAVIGNNYTPNIYAYATAFVNQEYNYGAAISFVLGVFVVAVSYAVIFLSNRRGTAATFSDPSSGLICFSIRPLSESKVLAFFAAPRRVTKRPASASDQ